MLAGSDAARRARASALEAAARAGRADLADDVALVATELVTNAMLHAGVATGVDFVVVEEGLRVEVSDPSPAPPVFGRPSDDSLTGRGIRVVSSIAARWGVEPLPDGGKVVWAEVTGERPPATASLAEADLLAMWDDDAGGAIDRHHVELGDVPIDLLLAAKAHVENVSREFALAQAGAKAGITSELPPHLASLLAALDGFVDARRSIKRQALEALERGKLMAHLSLDLPLSAADAAEAYLEALDEIDAYCRAARLLTLATPPQHRIFRQWYVGELVAQLRAAASRHPPPPSQPFESRLLEEFDVLVEAQQATERAARLYAVSAALASADTPEAVAQAVLNEGVAALGASGGGVLLATDEDRLALHGSVGYDEGVIARLRAESRGAELPAAYALRTGEPVWLESRTERDERFPALAGMEATTVSLCAVPLVVRGRYLGALRFSFTQARLFDEEERRFVQALAALTAQALDRSQLHQARIDVSRRLQRSLLPPELPVLPGLEVAALYHPFGEEIDVGGDFYDLWPVDERTWALAIGDVTGTGPEAAAITALVRYTLRALTLSERDPRRALEALNRAMSGAAARNDDRFCTCIFGLVHPGDTVELHLASGGHPPVVVRRTDGSIETVLVGGQLLGVLPDPDIAEAVIRLQPGEMALLLTDGVLEARDGRDQFRLDAVIDVLSSDVAGAADALAALRDAVLGHTGGTLVDDMAALAFHVPPH